MDEGGSEGVAEWVLDGDEDAVQRTVVGTTQVLSEESKRFLVAWLLSAHEWDDSVTDEEGRR